MGYVYLICDPSNQVYKIGVTRNKNSKRIKALQTGNPTQLHMLYIYECDFPFRLETMLHNKYMCKRVLNEWYELSNEEVSSFITTCNELNNRIKIMMNNPFFIKNLR